MSEQGYAGEIGSAEAFERMKADPNAVLIDVRTGAEWNLVGHPDLASLDKQPFFIEWQSLPDMARNDGFVEQVAAAGVPKDAIVLVLCRSGARSRHAAIALTGEGYAGCWNISDGFEGPLDDAGHRGTVSGWRCNGLPWRQG